MIVGVIKRNNTDGVRFKYIKKGVEEAENNGFTPYIDFPDINKEYTENVLETFGQRLIKTERVDIRKYLDFWAIDPVYEDDKYYLLAYTQGMQSNDNFEFLADFYPVKGLRFISEICGLTHNKVESGTLKPGDKLLWKLDTANPNDQNAVKVYKSDKYLGYIKLVHSRVFYKKSSAELKVTVKFVDQNGSVKRVFVEISF